MSVPAGIKAQEGEPMSSMQFLELFRDGTLKAGDTVSLRGRVSHKNWSHFRPEHGITTAFLIFSLGDESLTGNPAEEPIGLKHKVHCFLSGDATRAYLRKVNPESFWSEQCPIENGKCIRVTGVVAVNTDGSHQGDPAIYVKSFSDAARAKAPELQPIAARK